MCKYYCYKANASELDTGIEFLQFVIKDALARRAEGLTWVAFPMRTTVEHVMDTIMWRRLDVRPLHEFLLAHPYPGSFAIPLYTAEDDD